MQVRYLTVGSDRDRKISGNHFVGVTVGDEVEAVEVITVVVTAVVSVVVAAVVATVVVVVVFAQ
jgi:hypothetical protein